MNKLILLSIIFSIAYCQYNNDGVCAGTEVADGSHFELVFESGSKCIVKEAAQNLNKLKNAIYSSDFVSGAVVDRTFELSFDTTDPNDCAGSYPCFLPAFYFNSFKNKNDQDAAEASSTFASTKVVFDSTKLNDTTNWCEPENAQGITQCTITATFGFKEIADVLFTIPVTVNITVQDEQVSAVVGDTISVNMKDQELGAGISGSCLIERESTLTRHENADYDETPLTNPQKGSNVFLQLAADHATDQAIGPFKTTGYKVFLEAGENQIDITDSASSAETVNIGVDDNDNHVFRIQVQMNYVGTYSLKVEAEQPTPITPTRRVLEENKSDKASIRKVAKSFLSMTVLPKN